MERYEIKAGMLSSLTTFFTHPTVQTRTVGKRYCYEQAMKSFVYYEVTFAGYCTRVLGVDLIVIIDLISIFNTLFTLLV